MKKRLAIGLLFVLSTLQVSAQVKIGYTNPEEILAQLPEVQQIDREISELLATKDSLLAIKANALQKELDDYEAVEAQLSQEQKQQREQDLLAKNDQFEKDRQQSLNEVQQRQLALITPVRTRVFSAISEVARSLELDLVINKRSANGEGILFYMSKDQTDITDLVIEKLKQSK